MTSPKLITNSRCQYRILVLFLMYFYAVCPKSVKWSVDAVFLSSSCVHSECVSATWWHVFLELHLYLGNSQSSLSDWSYAGSHLSSALMRHCNIHLSHILPFFLNLSGAHSLPCFVPNVVVYRVGVRRAVWFSWAETVEMLIVHLCCFNCNLGCVLGSVFMDVVFLALWLPVPLALSLSIKCYLKCLSVAPRVQVENLIG